MIKDMPYTIQSGMFTSSFPMRKAFGEDFLGRLNKKTGDAEYYYAGTNIIKISSEDFLDPKNLKTKLIEFAKKEIEYLNGVIRENEK